MFTRSNKRLPLFLASTSVLCLLFSATVSAQEAGPVKLSGYEPTPGSDGVFSVDGSDIAPHLEVSGGFQLNYAEDGLNINNANGNTNIDERLTGDVLFSIGMLDAVEFGVALPVLLDQTGTSNGENIGGSETGDLRLRPKVALIDASSSPVGVALYTQVGLPTGDRSDLNSTGEFHVQPGVIVDMENQGFSLTANAGTRLERETKFQNFETGTVLTYGVGSEYELVPNTFSVGGEIYGTSDVAFPFGKEATTPIETMAGVKYKEVNTGLQFEFGGGTGVVEGYNTPDYRVMAGIRYVSSNRDADGDGLVAKVDRCPNFPEDKDGFEDSDGCPDLDNDNDGVADASDRCVMDAEDIDGFEDLDGCPDIDNDNDGIVDADDGCPMVAGQNGEGCPTKDLDVVVENNNFVDVPAAETKVIETTELVEVKVKEKEIKLIGQIHFDTDKATIQKKSHALLRELANTLKADASIRKLQIAGYADRRASDAYNLELSRERANATRDFLVNEGVEPHRLTTVAFGEWAPAVPVPDAEGQERAEALEANRRVRFKIVEYDESFSSNDRDDDSRMTNR